jgi:hypothetical protein
MILTVDRLSLIISPINKECENGNYITGKKVRERKTKKKRQRKNRSEKCGVNCETDTVKNLPNITANVRHA